MRQVLDRAIAVVWYAVVGIAVAIPSALAAAPGNVKDDATAAQVLARMADVYQNCKTNADAGMVKTKFITKEEEWLDEKPFTTAYVRPDRFRFEYSNKFPLSDSPTSIRHIIWANGKDVRTWWDVQPGVKKEVSLGMAIAAATGVSSGAAHIIPRLLMSKDVGGQSVAKLVQPERLADAALGNQQCYRIRGKGFSDKNDSISLWISKNTLLIHRIDEASEFDDFRTEKTTTYKPQTDITINKDKLEFNPSEQRGK